MDARLLLLLGGLLAAMATQASAMAHIDCVVSGWSDLSGCDEETMTQSRFREVLVQSSGYGRPCPALVESVPCRSIACAVTNWGEFGSCDSNGYKTRARDIARPARYGGVECGSLEESVKCKPVDCLVSRWSESVATEGEMTRVSTRSVLVPPRDGGRECPELVQFATISTAN